MATHASALKAHEQSLKNREHNRQFRSRLRGALKSIRAAIDGNDLAGGENRAEADHLADRPDGEQGRSSTATPPAATSRGSTHLALAQRPGTQRRRRGPVTLLRVLAVLVTRRRLPREPSRFPAHSSTTSRSSSTRGSPAELFRS